MIDWNGDCKQVIPPVPGAIAVFWFVQGHDGAEWAHKGWLMPQVVSESPRDP